MMIVFALAMSRPVSMIVVETSTSNLRSQKSTTICSSTCSLQLAVRDGDARLGHELGELRRDAVDRRHAVVHEEHLALAQQLAADRRGDLLARSTGRRT